MCPAGDGIVCVEIEDSLEAFLGTQAPRAGLVYCCTLAAIVAAAVAVLTVSVDLTLRAPAMLRPLVERQSLRAMSDGIVTRLAVQRDEHVRAEDTILVIGGNANAVAHRASVRANREQVAIASDLRLLLAADTTELQDLPARLAEERSRAIASEAAIEWRQLTIGVERATQSRDRLRQLAQRGFAAPAELESAELELRHVREGRTLALEQRRAAWAGELAAVMDRMTELQRNLAVERDAEATHAIVAPVAGTIEELAAVSPGTSVRQGDVIAVVSPDDALAADVLVPARDVGRIRRGMPVRLLMEGYDVQEWGAASGAVASIASDYVVQNDQPVFRVRVRLDHQTLQRADGRRVALRKGLRCQARFLAGRRKLSQLLMHRAREWMDAGTPDDSPGGH